MRLSFALPSLIVLAFAGSTHATLDKAHESTRLSPINVADFEKAFGIHRRAVDDYSHLEPSSKARMVFGRPSNNGKILLADMNLHASDGLNIVMMERFEGLTKSVDCKGDDGTMSLTFKSETAFNRALKTWNFINSAVEKKFLLIANHDGCGPDDQRQPYIINRIREDRSTLTTFLDAEKSPWSKVAHTFDLEFGKALAKPRTARTLKHRGLGSVLQGNIDKSKSVTFSIDVGKQGARSNIYSDEKGRISLDCVDCFVTGSFQVSGHLSVHHFKLQDFIVEASPEHVSAKLQLEANITAGTAPEKLEFERELFSFPIPDAGIEVAGIFKLGAIIVYTVGVTSSFQGQGIIDFGLEAGLADSAKVTADISNPESSSATGFNKVPVTPIFDVKSLSASVTVAAFSKPKLTFGIDITDIGHADLTLGVEIPKVSATLTAKFDENGVCSTTPGSSKTGVLLDSSLDIGVDLGVEVGFGKSNKVPFDKNLFDFNKPLFSTCFPINIPGLGGASTSIGLPSNIPSSASVVTSLTLSNSASASVPTLTPITGSATQISSVVALSTGVPVSTPSGRPSLSTGVLPSNNTAA